MMKMVFGVVLLSLATTAGVLGQQTPPLDSSEYSRIEPNAKAGFTYPYYLYVPPAILNSSEKKRVYRLLVLPNNTGTVSDDFAVHEADVSKRMAYVGGISTALNTAILMPVFPRPKSDWQIYTQALDRDSMLTNNTELRRFDLQLIAMIDDARKRLAKKGFKFDKRVLLSGFSAQGMFVNRFTFLHPDRVRAAAIGSPGGWPIAPVEKYREKKLRYPIGAFDLRSIVGKKLDLKKLRKVPLYIYLGDKDINDSVPFGDSYDDEDRELIFPLFGKTPVERWSISETLYKQADLNVVFKLYKDVPHTVTPLMREDVRDFLLKYVNQ